VGENRFREDLYYRLNVIQIEIPPLCDHPDDVENLANTMLAFFGAQNHKLFRGFSEEAVQALRNYSWPGNIRELRNVIERAAILSAGDIIGREHLPRSISPRTPSGSVTRCPTVVENHIRRVPADAVSQEAADILGIDLRDAGASESSSGYNKRVREGASLQAHIFLSKARLSFNIDFRVPTP
jgi:NtrC-family two-component system response regulator AlgB